MTKTLITALFSLAVITGCASTADNPQPIIGNQALNGSQWYMTGEYYQIADIALPTFTLTLEDEKLKINGSSGCNHFFGTVAIEKDKLVPKGPLGMTQKLCQDTANRIEFEFMQALEKGLIYKGGVFYTQSGAVFKPKPNTNAD